MTEPTAERRAAGGRGTTLRALGLGLVSFAVGYVFSDADRAPGAVAFMAMFTGIFLVAAVLGRVAVRGVRR